MTSIDTVFGVIGGVGAAALIFAAVASATREALRRDAAKRAREQAEVINQPPKSQTARAGGMPVTQ